VPGGGPAPVLRKHGPGVCYHHAPPARPGHRHAPLQEDSLATESELADFLAEVERRAWKQATYAVRDGEAALDIVQEAMMRLAEKYAARPVAELPLLFQRILQNAIRDWFRRAKVRNTWITPASALLAARDDDDTDPVDALQAPADPDGEGINPADRLQRLQTIEIIEEGLANLPARQREAFLLRYWEELDVAETAAAMGCSEGSVKTHCSRATHALAQWLERKGISL